VRAPTRRKYDKYSFGGKPGHGDPAGGRAECRDHGRDDTSVSVPRRDREHRRWKEQRNRNSERM
jgi:hypothetical protein